MFEAQNAQAQELLQRWHEAPFAKGGVGGQTRALSDPQQQFPFHLFSMNSTSRIVWGVITDVVPRAHCYRVSLNQGRSSVIAMQLGQTAMLSVGAKSIGILQPGVGVWLIIDQDASYGFILGVEPDFGYTANGNLSDRISQTSRTLVDDAWLMPVRMSDNAVVDWGNGRPMDCTAGAEQGWITPTGIRITLDDFFAQLATSEHCGVFAFYHDQLLRLAGVNMQTWTSGSVTEGKNDGGEFNYYHGSTPYPWEQLGKLVPAATIREIPSSDHLKDTPYYARWEPTYDDAQPFHRYRHFEGYLGQGFHDFLTAPAPNTTDYRDSSTAPAVGLFESGVQLDGRYFLRSAKAVHIAKRCMIAVPHQAKRAEDPTGDNPENYKAAGVLGDGDAPHVTGDFQTHADNPSLQRSAGLLDLHAYIFNYSGVHPFAYHAKDWSLPEEAAQTPFTQVQYQPAFSQLRSNQHLNAPTAKKVVIDSRYGGQDYYETTASLDLLDDGCVSLIDGFGAGIQTINGNLVISAPGDIMIKPGRNLELWSGRDVHLKAYANVEISATQERVRIKAEQDVMVLAGNGGTGGLLLESRGEGGDLDFSELGNPHIGGIVLNTQQGSLTMLAQAAYMRTLEGAITLDANKGQAPIIMNSVAEEHFVVDSVSNFYGSDGNIDHVDIFSADGAALAGTLVVNGQAVLTGGMILKGNLLISSGMVAAERAASTSGLVPALEGISLDKVNEAISQAASQADTALPQIGQEAYQKQLTDSFYGNAKPGNSDTIDKVRFTFRTTAQYQSEKFIIYEDRWQQLAGGVGQTWQERSVDSDTDKTMPYPGWERYQGGALLRQPLNLYSVPDGRDQPRTVSDYQHPSLAAPSALPLSNYLIIG